METEIEDTKAFYERYSNRWAETHTNSFIHEEPFRLLLTLNNACRPKQKLKNRRLIDIGCANGIHLPMFKRYARVMQYTGVDLSQTLVSLAREKYAEDTFFAGDISQIDTLPHGPFDTFWCAATLMHLPRELMMHACHNIERITRPRAFGYVTLPTAYPGKERPAHDTRHYTIMSEEEQREFFQNLSWEVRNMFTISGTKRAGVWRGWILQRP